MTLSATTLWLILAALLGIIELIATTFYLLVLAAAALVAAGAAWFGMELEWQISLFAVIAIVGSVWVRRIRSIPTKSDAHQLKVMHRPKPFKILTKARLSMSMPGMRQVARRFNIAVPIGRPVP